MEGVLCNDGRSRDTGAERLCECRDGRPSEGKLSTRQAAAKTGRSMGFWTHGRRAERSTGGDMHWAARLASAT